MLKACWLPISKLTSSHMSASRDQCATPTIGGAIYMRSNGWANTRVAYRIRPLYKPAHAVVAQLVEQLIRNQ